MSTPQSKISSWLLSGLLAVLSACQSPAPPQAQAPHEVHTASYHLIIPAEQQALLILFPCFPCDAADTRSESPIADRAVVDYL